MRVRLNLNKESAEAKSERRLNTTFNLINNNDFASKNETRNQIIEKMRGTKNLLKGISGKMPMSDYYENYK
jgi:hypothetical protein